MLSFVDLHFCSYGIEDSLRDSMVSSTGTCNLEVC
jgi:hypothetical protein